MPVAVVTTPAQLGERGIDLVLATTDDARKIWDFICREFFPEEPICRATGILGTDPLSRYVMRVMRNWTLQTCLLSPNGRTILAVSKGEMVGLLMGYLRNWSDPRDPSFQVPLIDRLGWLLPRRLLRLNQLAKFEEEILRYDPHLAMEDLGCESIFVGDIVCVSSSARCLGLARHLVEASIELAEATSAEVYMGSASGIYSQKLGKATGFEVLREIAYQDVTDRKGRALLGDTGEHKSVQIMYKRLRKRNKQ